MFIVLMPQEIRPMANFGKARAHGCHRLDHHLRLHHGRDRSPLVPPVVGAERARPNARPSCTALAASGAMFLAFGRIGFIVSGRGVISGRSGATAETETVMATATKPRVVVGEDGVINVHLHPSVMYNRTEFLKVVEGIIATYHPGCCSGLPIAYKLAAVDPAP